MKQFVIPCLSALAMLFIITFIRSFDIDEMFVKIVVAPVVEDVMKFMFAYFIAFTLKEPLWKASFRMAFIYGVIESFQYVINASNFGFNPFGVAVSRYVFPSMMHVASAWANMVIPGVGVLIHSLFNAIVLYVSDGVLQKVLLVVLVYGGIAISLYVIKRNERYNS